MASNTLNGVVRQIHRAALPHGGAELTDRELLDRYVSGHDEAAFEELVRRHGPMVLGVCRRILRNSQDAEDAFQATFLVLVRKAATVRPRGLLGNWLYGVAHNTALKANAMRRKRQSREREAGTLPRPESDDEARQQLQERLDEELSRLPEKYRVAIVLCELQGQTIKEAARQLGCPQGTVATRLSRGRALLARRLSRHGLAAPPGALAAGTALSDTLLGATLQSASLFAAGQATGAISPTITSLVEGVLKGMLLRKLKITAAVLGLVLAVGALAVLPALSRPAHSAGPPSLPPPPAKPAVEVPEPVEFSRPPIILLGGGSVAGGIAFSPDGKRVAAGLGNWDQPGRVQVWDVATRQSLWAQDEPRGIYSVAFSPDSKRLAWSGWCGQCSIDDVEPRRRRLRVPLPEQNFYVAYSRDGKWLALASENHSLRLLHPDTGRTAATLSGSNLSYFCVAFSNDSKLLAAGGGRWARWNAGSGPNQVDLFDVATRKLVGKLTGHTDGVLKVAFAPDDSKIATTGADGTIRLYDGRSFKPLSTIMANRGGCRGLAFSPDGTLLATGGYDRTIRLWGSASGKEVGQLEGHPEVVQGVAFSPDGKQLVSVGNGRTVLLWDVKHRKLLATLNADAEPAKAAPLVTMAVCPTGNLLALGTESGEVQLRDRRTGTVLRRLAGHEEAVTALAFSRDGKRLASGGPDLTVRLWEPATGKQVQALKGHTSWVYALAFAPDGKTLASGAYDRTVRLWDVVNGKPLGTLTGHRAAVRALAFSPDGKLLASGSTDQRIRLWDVQKRESRAVLKGHEGTVRAVAFAPRGHRLASAGEDGQLRLWDVVKGEPLGKPSRAASELLALCYASSGSLLVGSQNGTITTADGTTGALGRSWSGHTNGVLALGMVPASQEMLSLGGDGTVKLWRGQPAPLRHFAGHTGPVRIVTFSPDGKYLLSCSGWPEGDKTLRLWDVRSGKQVRLLMTGKAQLKSAAFSHDGKQAAAGDDLGVIHVFEVPGGKPVRELRGHKDTVTDLAFSADGKWLLSTGLDRTVRLWDAATGEQVRLFTGHGDWALCGVFHPDGKRIVTGGRGGFVRVWDRESGKELSRIDAHKERVERLALLPDGKRLLGCGGKFLRLWDLETGKVVLDFPPVNGGTNWLAVAKDGRTVLTTSYDTTTRLWDIETGLEVKRFHGHRNWVRCVDVAPDGRTFVTAGGGARRRETPVAGQDFTLRLWKMPPLPH